MTQKEADDLYKQHIQGGRRNPEIAKQICEVWNKGELKENWLGGTGYHERSGRICHNSHKLPKQL